MRSDTLTGRCLCGAIRFSFEARHHDIDICHCDMCRRWTAGPFFAIAHNGTVTFEGEDNLGVYQSSTWAERAFCRICGTPLYWRLAGRDEYGFSAGALDDQSALNLATEIFIDEKPAYYAFANDTKKMTGKEAMDALMAGRDSGQD